MGQLGDLGISEDTIVGLEKQARPVGINRKNKMRDFESGSMMETDHCFTASVSI